MKKPISRSKLLAAHRSNHIGVYSRRLRRACWSYRSELLAVIGSEVEVEWVIESANNGDSGIVAEHVMTPSGVLWGWTSLTELQDTIFPVYRIFSI